MSFRKVLFFGAAMVFGLAGSARAQLGVYGMYSGERFTGITCPTYAAPCGTSTGAVKPYGGTAGAYYDFMNVGPVRLGIDARGNFLRADKRADSSAGGTDIIRQYEVLGGVRGSVRTPLRWLKPYAEIAGGYTRNNNVGLYTITNFPPTTVSSLSYNPAVNKNYPMVKVFVGVDIKIFPFMDLRPIELGEGEAFGSAIYSQTVTASGTTTTTNSTLSGPSTHGSQSISAGIVIHLPSLR